MDISGICCQKERKNAALLHYAPIGSQVVRVAHAGRSLSGEEERVVEAVACVWLSGSRKSLLKAVYEVAQLLSRSLGAIWCPKARACLLEFPYPACRGSLEPAQVFIQEARFTNATGRRESRRNEVLTFLQDDMGLAEPPAEAALQKCARLLSCSVEANLKPTVEWLHEVGLSEAQVLKAISSHPQLLGYSIEANLKPTVEWLHKVGLSDARVSKAIAIFPSCLV